MTGAEIGHPGPMARVVGWGDRTPGSMIRVVDPGRGDMTRGSMIRIKCEPLPYFIGIKL